MNALPSVLGQLFSIVAGIWGPANDLARYLPMLEQVAASFSINDRLPVYRVVTLEIPIHSPAD